MCTNDEDQIIDQPRYPCPCCKYDCDNENAYHVVTAIIGSTKNVQNLVIKDSMF